MTNLAYYWSKKIDEQREKTREIKRKGQRIDLILDKSPESLPKLKVDYQLDINKIRGGCQK